MGSFNRPTSRFGSIHPHMLRAAFIMAALAGVPLRDVQIAARHADPRTTTIYDHRRENFDRHAAYVVVAFVAGDSCIEMRPIGAYAALRDEAWVTASDSRSWTSVPFDA